MTSLRVGSNLRALIVGIDHYETDVTPSAAEHPQYRNLDGCVQDALAMKAYLLEDLEFPPERLTCLLAPNSRPANPAARPTYERMAKALEDLLESSRPGDQVLFHYAGHGGRSPTLFPELKGPGGKDEGLVPTNIADPGSQYLRDVELAYWLARMAERKVFATLILDCCHAGGARRKKNPAGIVPVARSNEVEDRVRERPSLLASREALVSTWRDSATAPTPKQHLGSGWQMSPPVGHVVLAACCANQTAFEYRLPRGLHRGAFTFWLLHALRQQGPHITSRELLRRVKGRLHQLFRGDQTPQIEGDGERLLFEPRYRRRLPTIEVIGQQDEAVLLGAGQAQGLKKGMRLDVFPPDWAGEDKTEARCAVAEVSSVGSVDSTAQVIEQIQDVAIEAGCQVLSREPLLGQLRLFVERTEKAPEFRELTRYLERDATSFITFVPTAAAADWRLLLDAEGNLQIASADGSVPPNLLSPVHHSAPGAARKVVSQLDHLARFVKIEGLANFDPGSQLQGRLGVSMHLLPENFERGEEPILDSPLTEDSFLTEGQWVCLTLENQGEFPFYVTVLDLQPRFSILQIFPYRSDSHLLEPGGILKIPLCASLPEGLEVGRDLLKIFATLDSTNFECLEMPAMGEALRSTPPGFSPRNGLEKVLASMVDERFSRRDLTPRPHASEEWAVESKALWTMKNVLCDIRTEHLTPHLRPK